MRAAVWTRMSRVSAGSLAILTAAVAALTFVAALAMSAGSVAASLVLRDALAPAVGEATYQISTRLAEDPAAQDVTVMQVVDRILPVPFTAERHEVEAPGDTPFAQWDITIDYAAVTPDHVEDLDDAGEAMRQGLRTTPAAVRGVEVTDSLADLLVGVPSMFASAQAINVAPGLLFLAVAVIAVFHISGALTGARGSDYALLASRGASRRTIARHAVVESAIVSLLGAGAGVLVAYVVLHSVGGGVLLSHLLAAGLICLTVVGSAAVRAVASSMWRAPTRSRRTALSGLIVLVAAAAVMSGQRLLTRGLVTGGGPDDVAAASLAACALLGAAVLMALLVPLVRLVAGAAARRRSLTGPLATRLVARRFVTNSAVAMLVALATAATVVAGIFDASVAETHRRDTVTAGGADIRMSIPVSSWAAVSMTVAPSAVPFRDVSGVAAAVSGRVADATVGGEPATLTVLPVDAAREIVSVELPEGLTGSSAGIVVGGTAPELTFTLAVPTVEGRAPAEPVELVFEGDAWFMDADGAIQHTALVPAQVSASEVPRDVVVPLEIPTGAQRLVRLDLHWDGEPEVFESALSDSVEIWEALFEEYDGDYEATQEAFDEMAETFSEDGIADRYSPYEMELTSMALGGEPFDLRLVPLEETNQNHNASGILAVAEGEPAYADGALAVNGSFADSAEAPLIFAFVADADISRVPVAISSELAGFLAAGVGDPLDVTFEGPALTAEVVAVVDAIPGATQRYAVMADQGRLTEHMLGTRPVTSGPDEIWLAIEPGADAAVVLATLGEEFPEAEPLALAEPLSSATVSTRAVFWVVAAAALLAAWAGLASAHMRQARTRDYDALVLRSLGVSRRAVHAVRAGELYALAVPSMAGGVALGTALGYLILPPFIVEAAGSAFDAVIGVNWWWIGMALGVCAAGVVFLAHVTARAIPEPGEGARV